MRDVGLTADEARIRLDELYAELRAVRDEIERRWGSTYGHINNPDRRILAERQSEISSLISDIRESGTIPWAEGDSGGALDPDAVTWASRVVVRDASAYPEPAVMRPAIQIHVRTGSWATRWTILDPGQAGDLAMGILAELDRWDEDRPEPVEIPRRRPESDT